MADRSPAPGRQAWISLLRIAATLLVVGFHTCDSLTGHPLVFPQTGAQRTFLLAAGRFASWHVPVFFMLTGALLLDPAREITPGKCVKRYAFRMALALAVFGVPFALAKRVYGAGALTPDMLWAAVTDVLTGNAWDHLWYLYTLIGVYLLLPLFRPFVRTASRREMGYVLAVLLAFDFFTAPLERLTGWRIAVAVPVTYPVFYCLLGRYLAEGLPRPLGSRPACGVILLLTAAATVLTAVLAPAYLRLLTGNASPVNALAAAAAFSLCRGIAVPARWEDRLWRWDRLCFGVYLIHPVFIHFFYRILRLTPLSFGAYAVAEPCFFLAFAALSFLASWVMSRIPPLKKYIL